MYLNDVMTRLNKKKEETQHSVRLHKKKSSRMNLTGNEQHVCQIRPYSCLFLEYLSVF